MGSDLKQLEERSSVVSEVQSIVSGDAKLSGRVVREWFLRMRCWIGHIEAACRAEMTNSFGKADQRPCHLSNVMEAAPSWTPAVHRIMTP